MRSLTSNIEHLVSADIYSAFHLIASGLSTEHTLIIPISDRGKIEKSEQLNPLDILAMNIECESESKINPSILC